MILGFGGGGLGISRHQTEGLKDLLQRLTVEGAVHRGCTGMESMIHNVIRSVYPLIPVHVVPIIGVYSCIASTPVVPQTIIYQAGTPDVVEAAMMQTIAGLVFLPPTMNNGGPGWELVYRARDCDVPVIIIWPNGKVLLEENQL